MKKFNVLLLILLFMFGCNGATPINIDISKGTVEAIVKSAGMLIGYEASKVHEDVNRRLRDAYSLATGGKLTPETVNDIALILKKELDMNPVIAVQIIEVVQQIGGEVLDGKVTDLAGVDPALLEKLASGYVQGYDLGKAEQEQ